MVSINCWAILVCAVISMVFGFIWYGPLFGKKWMQLMGANTMTEEQKKEAMKGMWKLYVTQFVMVFFQMFVLAHYIRGWYGATGLENALWIWAAFVIPTLGSAAMWSGDSKENAWFKFAIQAGYNLFVFSVCGYILSLWVR